MPLVPNDHGAAPLDFDYDRVHDAMTTASVEWSRARRLLLDSRDPMWLGLHRLLPTPLLLSRCFEAHPW